MFLRGFTETRSVIQISVSMPISVDSAITVDFVLAGCYSRFDVQVSFTYLGLGGSAERSHSMDHETIPAPRITGNQKQVKLMRSFRITASQSPLHHCFR